MNVTLSNYAQALWPYWEAAIPGFLLVVHEFAVVARPSYRQWMEDHLPIAWRLLIILFVISGGVFWASYQVWKVDQEEFAKMGACIPKIEWGPTKFDFDNNRYLPVVIRKAIVTRKSRHNYGVYFEARGGDGKGIWAENENFRRIEFKNQDRERIQLQPAGMAHFLYMPEGTVNIIVWAENPTKVDFQYRVECF